MISSRPSAATAIDKCELGLVVFAGKRRVLAHEASQVNVHSLRTQSNARGDTAAQLRDDIDQGCTGDKVRFPDPAVAPLGTDEEAAGTPVDPRVIAQVREREAKMAQRRDAQRSAEGGKGDVVLWFVGVG